MGHQTVFKPFEDGERGSLRVQSGGVRGGGSSLAVQGFFTQFLYNGSRDEGGPSLEKVR